MSDVVFKKQSRITLRKCKSRHLLAAFCVLTVAVVSFWVWKSGSEFASRFSRIAALKQLEIHQRVELEKTEELIRLRKKFLQSLVDEDLTKGQERKKWLEQIEQATVAYSKRKGKSFKDPFLKSSLVKFVGKPNPNILSVDSTLATPVERIQFWSLRRIQPTHPPLLENGDVTWCQNPIDRFVLRKLNEAGLVPNSRADSRTLARRFSFDITGLPLSERHLKNWNDDSGWHELGDPLRYANYANYVDSLLSQSSFGEHWAQVWLDVAGYADSNGYEEDEIRFKAYAYRDFVIWAMNFDLPFNEFASWQIAGDELEPQNPLAVAATGFMTTAPYNTFIPQESERMDELDKIVSTYSSAILGMTVGCARCHDHMYDDISSREYYRLVSIFSETKRGHSYLVPDQGKSYRVFYDPVHRRHEELDEMQFRRLKEDRIAALEHFTDVEKDILRKPVDPNDLEQERLISLCERCLMVTEHQLEDEFEPLPVDRKRFDELTAELKTLEQRLPMCPPQGLTLTGSSVSTTALLENGDLKSKSQCEQVGPGFLASLTVGVESWDENQWKNWAPDPENPLPRSALAVWTTDVEKGAGALIARVVVNRIWQQYFGNGLVGTAGDFGFEGELPTHPELLEWLAAELIENDWSLKHIHRLILNSATYQQDSTATAEKLRIDPRNEFVGRFVTRRISAEMMRDSMLSIAGNLNTEMYGPGVMPPIPRDAVYNTQAEAENTWPINYEIDRESLWRRGIYVVLKRTVPVPMLRLFDAPDGSFACQKRKTSTLPTQALALFNSPFVLSQSKRLAVRLSERESDPRNQIKLLVKLTFGRSATGEEIEIFLDFLQEKPGSADANWQLQNLQALCQVLFMSNEFFYVN